MHSPQQLYLSLLLLSFIASAALLFFSLRRRNELALISLSLLSFLCLYWTITNACEVLSPTLKAKLFWSDMQYLVFATLPVTYLVLALQHSGRERWLTRSRLFALLIIPIITFIVAWTNPLDMLRQHPHLDFSGPFPVIAKSYGPWFWVHVTYSYTLFVAAIYLFIRQWLCAQPLYRGQSLALLSGLLIPLTVNLLYIMHIGPFSRFDFSPAVLTFSVAIIAWGLMQYRLFEVIPIARDRVIESMSDGMIILDMQDRIIDINPAGENMLCHTAASLIGVPLAHVMQEWPEFIRYCEENDTNYAELSILTDTKHSVYEVNTSELSNHHKKSMGRLVLLHNITERKRAEASIRQMAYHDQLTGLPNRHYFRERLVQELGRAQRHRLRFAVLLLDLNGFKMINDTLGHAIGDRVLCEVGNRIKQIIRESDTVSRLGGDEFTILVTDIGGLDDAFALVSRIDSAFTSPIDLDNHQITISVSIGISLYPRDGDNINALLRKADEGMYQEKRSSKSKSAISTPTSH